MFRDVLKQLRKERKVTQEQLAGILGVERSTIGKYESSSTGKEVIPSVDVLNRMADYFGVTTDYLLDRDTKKDPAGQGEVARSAAQEEIMQYAADASEEEQQKLLDYIRFLRSQRG